MQADDLLEQLRIAYDVAKIDNSTGLFSIFRRYDDGDMVEDSGWHSPPQEMKPHTIFVEAFGLSRKAEIVNGQNRVHLKALDKNTLYVVCPNRKEVMVCEICEYDGGYTVDTIELVRYVTKSDGEHCLAICKCTMSGSWTKYRWYIVSVDGSVSKIDLS